MDFSLNATQFNTYAQIRIKDLTGSFDPIRFLNTDFTLGLNESDIVLRVQVCNDKICNLCDLGRETAMFIDVVEPKVYIG